MNQITARKATALTKKYLHEMKYPYRTVLSKTISFSDLARDGRVFTSIYGLPQLEEDELKMLQEYGRSFGFTIDVFL